MTDKEISTWMAQERATLLKTSDNLSLLQLFLPPLLVQLATEPHIVQRLILLKDIHSLSARPCG